MFGNHPDDHAIVRLFLAAHPEITMDHLRAVKESGLSWPNWIRILSTYYGDFGPALYPAIQAVCKLIVEAKAASPIPAILMEELADICPAGIPVEIMLSLATEIASAIAPQVVMPKAVTDDMRERHKGEQGMEVVGDAVTSRPNGLKESCEPSLDPTDPCEKGLATVGNKSGFEDGN